MNRVVLPFSSKHNYRQPQYACGAFSVSAVVRILQNRHVDPFELARAIRGKTGKGIFPLALEKEIKRQGLNVEMIKQKGNVDALRKELSQGHPIIILGRRKYEGKNVQHFITLVGYDDDSFYIYDSLHGPKEDRYTLNDNRDLPGNRSFLSSQLLDFWKRGGILGFYRWYGIIVAKLN